MAAPIQKVVKGNVTLAVFENTVTSGGKTFTTQSVTIQKSYKDNKDGKWKNSTSFKPNELMFVQLAIDEFLQKHFDKKQIDEVEFPD